MTSFTPAIKEELKEKKAGKVHGLGDMRFYECPLSCITPDTREMMRLCFMVVDTGRLLHPGEWGAQPAWLVEAYEIHKAEAARQSSGQEDDA